MHAPPALLPTFWQPERVRVALPFDRGPSFAAAREEPRLPSTSPRSIGTEPRTLHRDQLETGTMQLTHSVGHGQCPQPVHARHPLPGLPNSPVLDRIASLFDVAPMATGQAPSLKFTTVCPSRDCQHQAPHPFHRLREAYHPTLPYLRTVAIEPA